MEASLQVAAAVLVAVLALALILSRRSVYKSHVQQLQSKPRRKLVIGTWSREEVAKHKTADDLWVIIQDQDTKEWKVYDLTDYVDDHPGGMAIMYNAGGDATKGFHGPQHPSTVHELAKDFCIGTLADP